MNKKKTLNRSIAIALLTALLGLTGTAPSFAAKCTSVEIASMKKVDFEMALASISGDLTDLFKSIEKAKKATKKKSLKSFYSKLESAVEGDNGVLRVGDSRTMWRTLQSKYTYNRC
jgi:hypothetical protein